MPIHRDPRLIYPASILGVITLYFLYMMVPWLGDNLWNDEIYTLEKFTLVPPSQIITDYHVPNNHVLYNILDHLYLSLLGIHSLQTLMEHPWILRLPMLLLALGTLLLVYRTGREAGGRLTGILAVAILATTIAFQNFCLQVRGYGLSMFFDLLLFYSVLRYTRQPRRRCLVLMAIAAFAAIYTIPSNLYCVAGVLVFLTGELLRRTLTDEKVPTDLLPPLAAAAVGISLALLCYAPIYHQVFSNEYIHGTSTPFSIWNANIIAVFFSEMMTGRVAFYILFAECLIIYLILPLPAERSWARAWRLAVLQLVTPAAMLVARGENPPDRVFVYLSVFLALMMAINLVYVIRILVPRLYQAAAVTLLVVYLILICQWDRATIADTMARNLQAEARMQDLRMDYYLHGYHPLDMVHYLSAHGGRGDVPVVLASSEPHDMPEYLEAFGLPYYGSQAIDELLRSHHRVFLITLFPHELDADFVAAHHCTVTEVLTGYEHLVEVDAR